MAPRTAVVIGINYDHFPTGTEGGVVTRASANALDYAEADARDMAAVLKETGYDVVLLVGTAATREGIITKLTQQVRKAGPAGFLLVHFSGHGLVDPEYGNTAYILPVDADPADPKILAIPLADLASLYLGNVPSALILLDCCHSGYALGLKGRAIPADAGDKFGQIAQNSFDRVPGRLFITACAGEQLAREMHDLKHGAFTYYTLEWWRTAIGDDFLNLADYLVAALDKPGLPLPAYGGSCVGRQFLREAPTTAVAQTRKLSDVSWRDSIYQKLVRLEQDRLRDLLFLRLDLDYDTFPGANRHDKTKHLISQVEDKGLKDLFTDLVDQALAQQEKALKLARRITGADLTAASIAQLWNILGLDYEGDLDLASWEAVRKLIARAELAGQFAALKAKVRHAIAQSSRQAAAQAEAERRKKEQEEAARQARLKAEQEEAARQARLKAEQEEATRQARLKAEQEATERQARLRAEQEAAARQASPTPAQAEIEPGWATAPQPDEHIDQQQESRTEAIPRPFPTQDRGLPAPDAATDQAYLTLRGHRGQIDSAAFSPDGTRIVTTSFDKMAKVWDATTGQPLHTLRDHTSEVNSAAFSPDGTLIVTASNDRTAKVWDAATGQERLTLRDHKGIGTHILEGLFAWLARYVYSAAFSPDGTLIVTASNYGTAKVWDAATGQELLTLRGHTSEVNSAAFSPDGTRIVTASNDYTAKVWDATTGQELLTLRGHTSYVNTATFSPDGTRIVTASLDNTAKVWDATTGQERLTLRGHRAGVNTATFSPDGTRIVTASDDTTKVWDVPPIART